jgi:hypothetical protein
MGTLVGEPMKAEQVGHRLPFAAAFSALVVEFAFYGVSLVLLFSAGVVTLFPSSAVLFVAVMAFMVVPFVRNRNGGIGIVEPRQDSQRHVANVITRVFEKVRRLGDPVLMGLQQNLWVASGSGSLPRVWYRAISTQR